MDQGVEVPAAADVLGTRVRVVTSAAANSPFSIATSAPFLGMASETVTLVWKDRACWSLRNIASRTTTRPGRPTRAGLRKRNGRGARVVLQCQGAENKAKERSYL